ncbi:MAG: hydroxyacylglutathione hydrolase [Legionellaceae bacterium]|nr:hydroxyacylglutathione hydrolase [Legionellaceae bacterium]
MNITPLAIFNDNYIWLVINKEARTVVAVDPGDAAPLKCFLDSENLTLTDILITHYHMDHIGGVSNLIDEYHPNVYTPKSEKITGSTCLLTEGDKVILPSIDSSFEVLEIPGHTLGHIAYYSPGVLFCGDTLFSAGCGRIFEGSPEQMYASIQKIANLPEKTKVYCTHEYTMSNLQFAHTLEPSNIDIQRKIDEVRHLRKANLPSLPTTIEDEKTFNPFLRCDSQQITSYLENHFGLNLNSQHEVFKYLRKLKDNF